MKALVLPLVFAALMAAPVPAPAAEASQTPDEQQVIVEFDAMVPMRDGVRLATDIFRPAKKGHYPVILVRDPYWNGTEARWMAAGRKWAEQGYVYLFQNVRGRIDSEGTFRPYVSEITDGYDTQQWATKQSWSNGKVGTLGQSYAGSVQWLSAHLRAPGLTAMAPRMTPLDYYSDVAYPGGAFSLGSRLGWGTLIEGRTNQSPGYDWKRLVWHLPLATFEQTLGMNLPHWRDWVSHPSRDAYWDTTDTEARLKEMDVPAYSVGGWYDVFLRGTLSGYTGMRKHARSVRARDGQRLLIGPWNHTAKPTRKLGELDFGAESEIDFDALVVPWFDHWLKEGQTQSIQEPPVRLFVMGENRWRSENEWPLARTQYVKFYLRSAGNANTMNGDGTLERVAPETSEAPDEYAYDPRDPVPTLGGSLMFAATPAGPFDQQPLADRNDVLVFQTQPLESNVEVTGPLSVTLYAASSATDTDFTAKLLDVHPNNKAYNLADGIIRARYRKSFDKPQLLTPGEVNEYVIDLWATSNVFLKGHRIRVDISSSNFPRFDRNPNTGSRFGVDARTQIARQTLYHDAQHPSHIVLPVIPQ